MRAKKGSALDTDLPYLTPTFHPSGGHEGNCLRTSGASLWKHLENLNLLQPVILSELSVL